jgi:hypothetical protein
MLFSFVDHQRNKKDVDSVNVTYLVCGIKEDDQGNIVSLLRMQVRQTK